MSDASLLTHALDGELAPVAPRDVVRVQFQNETHQGTVRALRAGYLLVDIETGRGPVLALVNPDAIVDIISRNDGFGGGRAA